MRSIIGFLAAAGLAFAAVPAAADPGAVLQDAYVGSHWDVAPSSGAAVATADPGAGIAQDAYVGSSWDLAPTAGTAATAAYPVGQDAFVGANWDRTPGTEAPSTPAALAAAKPDPRASSCGCPCLARR